MRKENKDRAVYQTPDCLFKTICITRMVATSFGTTDLEDDNTDQEGSWINI